MTLWASLQSLFQGPASPSEPGIERLEALVIKEFGEQRKQFSNIPENIALKLVSLTSDKEEFQSLVELFSSLNKQKVVWAHLPELDVTSACNNALELLKAGKKPVVIYRPAVTRVVKIVDDDGSAYGPYAYAAYREHDEEVIDSPAGLVVTSEANSDSPISPNTSKETVPLREKDLTLSGGCFPQISELSHVLHALDRNWIAASLPSGYLNLNWDIHDTIGRLSKIYRHKTEIIENISSDLEVPVLGIYVIGSYLWEAKPNDIDLIVIIPGKQKIKETTYDQDILIPNSPLKGGDIHIRTVGLDTLEEAVKKPEDKSLWRIRMEALQLYGIAVPLSGIDYGANIRPTSKALMQLSSLYRASAHSANATDKELNLLNAAKIIENKCPEEVSDISHIMTAGSLFTCGCADDAVSLLVGIIREGNSVESQLLAINTLSQSQSRRALDYLNFIYEPEIKKIKTVISEDLPEINSAKISFERCPMPLRNALELATSDFYIPFDKLKYFSNLVRNSADMQDMSKLAHLTLIDAISNLLEEFPDYDLSRSLSKDPYTLMEIPGASAGRSIARYQNPQ